MLIETLNESKNAIFKTVQKFFYYHKWTLNFDASFENGKN